MSGNTKLVNYGIQTEESDIRAHVGVLAGKVYVYSTVRGLDALSDALARGQRELPAYTTGPDGHRMVTAGGYAVPVSRIKHVAIDAADIIRAQNFSESDSTTAKGNKAQNVVEYLLKRGLFPLPVAPEIVRDVDMQRQGLDLMVRGTWRIQVKCDWRAGTGHPQCTGNLFLQTAECNPFGRN